MVSSLVTLVMTQHSFVGNKSPAKLVIYQLQAGFLELWNSRITNLDLPTKRAKMLSFCLFERKWCWVHNNLSFAICNFCRIVS